MNRRSFLQQSGALAGLGLAGLAGCGRRGSAPAAGGVQALPFYDAVGPIVPIRAHVDRIFRTTVCLRPFRAAGPRTDVEHVGNKVVVHNFGHGGSGWSLSWGAADIAVKKAREAATGSRDVAVIGCGALGLTAAITAQRTGLRVTIFAKERPPYVRSSRATGVWSPDSRIALTSAAAPEFGAQWEAMARTSFAMYQSYLGLPGTPIEWTDAYMLSDTAPSEGNGAERRAASPGPAKRPEDSATHDFAHYEAANCRHHAGLAGFATGDASVSDEVRESDIAADVQCRRLLAAADERLPDCRRCDRDEGVSVTARCGVGAAAGDHQLPWVWRQKALVG